MTGPEHPALYDRNARLYDVAFSWDVGPEVDWLLGRLGKEVKTILEPACGSGRMFPAFLARGVEVAGVDLSQAMLSRATARMARLGLPAPRTLHGDMADFDFGRTFDGAICPINSFGYLLDFERALSHLACVARHLAPGRKYLLQVDLWDAAAVPPPEDHPGSIWEAEADGCRVRASWRLGGVDRETSIEMQAGRIEVLEGPDKGLVLEEAHRVRRWTWDDWADLVAASPFRQAAAYDGWAEDRRPVPLDRGLDQVRLTWHELVR